MSLVFMDGSFLEGSQEGPFGAVEKVSNSGRWGMGLVAGIGCEVGWRRRCAQLVDKGNSAAKQRKVLLEIKIRNRRRKNKLVAKRKDELFLRRKGHVLGIVELFVRDLTLDQLVWRAGKDG